MSVALNHSKNAAGKGQVGGRWGQVGFGRIRVSLSEEEAHPPSLIVIYHHTYSLIIAHDHTTPHHTTPHRVSKDARESALADRLTTTTDFNALSACDVVIEAG